LISNEIHNPVLKTSLVFAGFFCYNCKRRDYILSTNNILLKSSYEVKKADFERELLAMLEQHPDCLVWNCSIKMLKLEWAAHNAFHALGILRRKTADTAELAAGVVDESGV